MIADEVIKKRFLRKLEIKNLINRDSYETNPDCDWWDAEDWHMDTLHSFCQVFTVNKFKCLTPLPKKI